jgi:hypothetical protein
VSRFLTTSHRYPFLLHHIPSLSFPFLTTSLPQNFRCHHFLPHLFPSSPLAIVAHFPLSPLPFLPSFLTTSLCHHPSSPPLPPITPSLPHLIPSSPLFFVTTSHSHHFLHHHCHSSPLPSITTSLHRNSPSSPLPFFPHHFPSLPPSVTASFFVMYCYLIYQPSSRSIPYILILFLCIVVYCYEMYHPSPRSIPPRKNYIISFKLMSVN